MSDARAYVIPLAKKQVKIKRKFSDKEEEFSVAQKGYDISPVSELKVVGHQDKVDYKPAGADLVVKPRRGPRINVEQPSELKLNEGEKP